MGFGGKNRKVRGSHGRPWARKRKHTTRAQRRRDARGPFDAGVYRGRWVVHTPHRCRRCYAIPDGDGLSILRCKLSEGHNGWHKDSNGARWREDSEGVTVRPRAYAGHITAVVRWKP